MSDEPSGRWENRCEYTWLIDTGTYINNPVRVLVCDRSDGHAGLHTGRIFRFTFSTGTSTVIGYARRPA